MSSIGSFEEVDFTPDDPISKLEKQFGSVARSQASLPLCDISEKTTWSLMEHIKTLRPHRYQQPWVLRLPFLKTGTRL